MLGRSGKLPTMLVRRRISRLRRSVGLSDQIWRQISLGADARPAWALGVTTLTPFRPRAVRSRKKASQEALFSLVTSTLKDLGVPIIVDASRDQPMYRHQPRPPPRTLTTWWPPLR